MWLARDVVRRGALALALPLIGPLVAGLAGGGCSYPELPLLDEGAPDVPGGSFYRSYDVSGDGEWGNRNAPASISAFALDKYEVTVNRFRAFVEAGYGVQSRAPYPGAGAHAKIVNSGWEAAWNPQLELSTEALEQALACNSAFATWTDSPGDNERRPINCVTWYEAMAFCIWDGGYLPTEAEWNYAATGGYEQRAYPWSSPPSDLTLDRSRASYRVGDDCTGDGHPECSRPDLGAVGTKPAGDGRWGHSDLAGNVWEWNLDWARDYETSCVDCAMLITSGERVIRGGGFSADARYQRAASRSGLNPTMRFDFTGFRCARPATAP